MLVLSLVSCGKTKTSKQTTTKTEINEQSQSTPTNLEATNLGPTGIADPVDQYTDTNTDNGVTAFKGV